MKVLVISQTVFSKTSNMGKTLASYFTAFTKEELAQLYFHSEKPTITGICQDYYRFSDIDALKSIITTKNKGESFRDFDIVPSEGSARTDTGLYREAYKLGSKHKAWVLLFRDTMWKLSKWKNSKLLSWIDEINPDVIFFASGDCTFSYRIARTIKETRGIPMVMACVDDYYINNRNKDEVLGIFRQRLFMKTVESTVKDASVILTICDTMNRAYSDLFKKRCYTIHTAVNKASLNLRNDAKQVSYIGNVGYNRYKQLITMGEALSKIKNDSLPKAIDVYSGSVCEEYIEPLKSANGIRFHGSVPADEVPKIMENSMALIHTEAFDEGTKELVRFSVSTKIAESLMCGPCLIAYGPEGIASIDYLKENNAAYVITRPEDLESGLEEILTNGELRARIVKNARALAAKNHSSVVNPKKVREWLEEVVSHAVTT